MIFSESSYRRAVSQAPNTNRIPDTLYRRTLHGHHRIFHWRTTLFAHRRTLWFNWKLDREDAEKHSKNIKRKGLTKK